MPRPPQIPPSWVEYAGEWFHPSRLPLAARQGAVVQSDPGRALEQSAEAQERRPGSLDGSDRRKAATPGDSTRHKRRRSAKPVVCVQLISVRKRLADEHDNLRIGFKSLIDSIAGWLGLDDADGRIRWDIRQIQGQNEGTIVVVSLENKSKKC
jgi:hypothetical protein